MHGIDGDEPGPLGPGQAVAYGDVRADVGELPQTHGLLAGRQPVLSVGHTAPDQVADGPRDVVPGHHVDPGRGGSGQHRGLPQDHRADHPGQPLPTGDPPAAGVTHDDRGPDDGAGHARLACHLFGPGHGVEVGGRTREVPTVLLGGGVGHERGTHQVQRGVGPGRQVEHGVGTAQIGAGDVLWRGPPVGLGGAVQHHVHLEGQFVPGQWAQAEPGSDQVALELTHPRIAQRCVAAQAQQVEVG